MEIKVGLLELAKNIRFYIMTKSGVKNAIQGHRRQNTRFRL